MCRHGDRLLSGRVKAYHDSLACGFDFSRILESDDLHELEAAVRYEFATGVHDYFLSEENRGYIAAVNIGYHCLHLAPFYGPVKDVAEEPCLPGVVEG